MESGNRGFSLTETLVIITLLGIVTVVAIPSFAPVDTSKLDLAAAEIAGALRFAQNEALRSGVPHGVRFDAAANDVRVFRLDLSGALPVEVYDVRNPLDKKLYTIDLDDFPFTRGVSATGSFQYLGSSTLLPAVAFDVRGEPIAPDDLDPLDANTTGSVTIQLGGTSTVVSVAPVTGRISRP